MKQASIITAVSKLALLGLAGLLVACGGSSGGSSVVSTATSGYVVAAPVAGASVVVKDIAGNTLAGPVTTSSDGSYSIDTGGASSATFIIESSGGTYTDEATGQSTTAGMMAAYVDGANLAAGSQVHLTPASTIVHDMVMNHGMSLSAALSTFKDTFGFDADDTVAPADATDPATTATDEALLAGLRMAAFSQLTMDLGLSADRQSELLVALAEDLADGRLDGEGVTGAIAMLPADVHSRFSRAMLAFHDSSNNKTGLANDAIGIIPFAKVALTDTYRIEYVPGMMAAMEGKAMFKLHITDKNTGAAEPGLTVTLMPMMHMADHMHSSPDLDCTDAGAGDYDCTVYYLMASTMATGVSMGYWELKVMAGMNESATFYPTVMMAMGDTPKVTLKGRMGVDVIPGLTGDMSRNYFVFKESLTGMGDTRSFTMFVAAMEDMSSYPAVSVDTTLNAGTAYQLVANPMTVEVSSDASNWVTAIDNGNGKWSASPVAGLVDGTAATIYVRLRINNEQKTMDGMVPAGDGSNDFGMFTLTPGGM